jgi:hypothetical protein
VNEKQAQTYRLAGVQAEDGSTGTLVFEVKPGGNVHAEFEPETVSPEQPPQATQLPAEPATPPDPAESNVEQL